jgi:DNA-binding CsgD family transcriptional regulator
VKTRPAVEEGRYVPVPELSLTEERIVRLLAEGRLSKGEIAEAVGLDERTVDWHLERASRKLERAAALHKRVKGRQT